MKNVFKGTCISKKTKNDKIKANIKKEHLFSQELVLFLGLTSKGTGYK
jgi:hypothetical protein